MAQLIDTSYFIGEISLPGSVLTGSLADIDPYIVKYEREALISLLGYTLYKELKAEIDSTPQVFTTKWDRLVNGHEYEIDYLGDTHLVKWNGLINSDKISLLAYYIFYQYAKDHNTHTGTVGEMLSKPENASKFSPSQRMVDAWNCFIDLRGDTSQYEVDPTCYNFLNEFEEDDYDKWLFTIKKHTNTFGI